MGARKPGPQGERDISRKTIAWGMPDVSGASAVNTRVHTPTPKRTRGCGCIGHPAFPAPSPFPEGGSLNNSGARRAARGRTRILRCLTSELSALAQEHVIRGVGHALEAAGRIAGALEISALGVNSLHGGDIGKDTAAAMGGHVQLEPGNIVWRCARGVAGGLTGDRAAVAIFLVRSGVVPADILAVEQQRRDRFAEDPG